MIPKTIHGALDLVAMAAPSLTNEMTPEEARRNGVKALGKGTLVAAGAIVAGAALSHAGHNIGNYIHDNPDSTYPIPDVVHLPELDEQVIDGSSNAPSISELPHHAQYDMQANTVPLDQK